ncbi:MAG: ATP-binding protein [Anaerolineae bacterium]|nr:ATP-binding protein [Anaerolineae bacterium]
MPNEKFQKRIQALFSDIEQLATQPQLDAAVMRRELESLRARVTDLEAQVLQSQVEELDDAQAQQTIPADQPAKIKPSAPIIYEKEQVGYAYTADRIETLKSANISGLDANQVLLAPLTETGKPIGSMLVEPPADGNWSSDEAELTEAVARQVSLQIQNLRLLAAAERARAEAQSATRRFAHESWESFLDAIQQSERIGYVYDQDGVVPYSEPLLADTDFNQTVSVLDEHIGRLSLKPSPGSPLTEDDKAMVAAVARQLGQQVENLRLLADASRARAEAEEATRRMSRDSWKAYAEDKEESSLGFVYDSVQVKPLTQKPEEFSISHPLMVRGQPIGELAAIGLSDVSPEVSDLLAAIAAQTSVHLEALRLTEELQKRAAELQELDRLKSSFLANMSHELRTPLNSILGFSDVILEGIDGPLTEYMENDLRLIQKNGQHLLHLINDVLDMAKIESGRMNLHLEKFKVHEVFDEVASITSTLASEKNLALFVEPDSDAGAEIFADVTRMRQVIINLVNNAIKFTEKGKISMRVDRLGADKVLLRIKDTGIGIPPDHIETVFQEFSQVDTSTTRKVGGTGLGLPISRRLIEMHGGRMWAESTGIDGEGSAFFVELWINTEVSENVEKTVK